MIIQDKYKEAAENGKRILKSIKADRKSLSSMKKKRKKLSKDSCVLYRKIGVILYREYTKGTIEKSDECNAAALQIKEKITSIVNTEEKIVYLSSKISAADAEAFAFRKEAKTDHALSDISLEL